MSPTARRAAGRRSRHGRRRRQAPHEALSHREYEVLCLLGSGRTVKEISADLRLSPKTISTYRARLLEKMHATTNADLVRYASQHGSHPLAPTHQPLV